MAERKVIGLREVRSLQPNKKAWDLSVPSFGIRRQRSPAVTYFVKYRTTEGWQRWHTIGRHGAPWTPDDARKEARRVLGEVASGKDPAGDKRAKRKASTVATLCDQYMEAARAGRVLTRARTSKKTSTLEIDKGRIERHIKPLIGGLSVAAVTSDDVERLLHDIAEGRTAARTRTAKKRGMARVTGGRASANRVVGLLGAIFTYAVRQRMRADNPVRGVSLFEDRKRERRLTDDEYLALSKALQSAKDHIWPPAVAAARLLALTGWRRGEALSLRWSEVDFVRRTAILGDTKTGRSLRPLSHQACDLLKHIDRVSPLVFPATRGDGPMTGFPKMWARIIKLADLPSDITPHVLRHSFASLAGDLGYSEPTIAALVGHKGRTVTSRYVHAADAVLLAAADAVAKRTASLLGDHTDSVVVNLPNRHAAV